MSISCIIIIINAISVRGIDQWAIRTPQPMPGPSQHKGPGDEVDHGGHTHFRLFLVHTVDTLTLLSQFDIVISSFETSIF
jgi:hypothetical protein